ncbi:MAG TPA: hypothetical protein DHW39_03875, partial [Erysipelotrichaceae bacterium]|nr:hypothetical protein [Erysipelotrichaceae bacterium]
MGLVVFLTTYSLIMPGVSINKDTAEEEPGIVLNDSDSENNVIQEANTEENKEEVQTDTRDLSREQETISQENEDIQEVLTEENTEENIVQTETTYPAQSFAETIENVVTVKADAEEGTFPEGTTMILTPVEQEEVIDTVKETVEGTVKHIVAVDITFKDVNGNEIEPLKQINVTMNAPSVEDTTATEVVHIDNEGNGTLVEQEESAEDEVIFNTDTFSVYVIAYTVDFHYEVNGKEYETSINGGNVISLTELLPSLHVIDTEKAEEFVGNIRTVTFTDETLVRPVYIEEDVTVEELFRRLSITPEYSSEYTEEEINTILSKELHTGEWVLVSLKPFTTEETMTVTMRDDEVFTVKVTDAQIYTHVITANGEHFQITVTYDEGAKIPDGSKLAAREIEEGSEEYEKYLEEAAIEWEEAERKGFISYARFFNLEIQKDGKKVEPEAPVEVEIDHEDGFTLFDDESISVIHFAENGTEIIDNLHRNEEGTEIVYEQNGFSVIGTVSTVKDSGWPTANGQYVLVLQDGDDYYALKQDGTLTKIRYFNNTVSFIGEGTTTTDYINDYLWYVQSNAGVAATGRISDKYYENGSSVGNQMFIVPT